MKYFPVLFFTFFLLLVGCNRQQFGASSDYDFKATGKIPVYSDLHYWAAHPWKKDPSDSVPAPLRKGFVKDSLVDVFFIYPTSFYGKNESRWNAPIDDAAINRKTDYSSILYQASVFNEQCRVFAPRYRQAHLRAFFTNDTNNASSAFELAYTDVHTAFEYYMAHFNNGRPIIIAAHSQGTLHGARLLKEYFDGKPLQQKLVCAYLPGLPVPENVFSSIPVCKDSLATGGFMSWRTFKKGYIEPRFVAKETIKAAVVNPLTWDTSSLYAPASLNKGSVLKKFNKIKPGVADAQVHGNVLWSCKPKFFGNFLIRTKNYHIGDINLYYTSIREDVKRRIGYYWKR